MFLQTSLGRGSIVYVLPIGIVGHACPLTTSQLVHDSFQEELKLGSNGIFKVLKRSGFLKSFGIMGTSLIVERHSKQHKQVGL